MKKYVKTSKYKYLKEFEKTREEQLLDLKDFIQNTFGEHKIQMFNTRNTANDYMKTIYKDENIIVDYAPFYDYIEVFGLTDDEYFDLHITY